MEVLKPKWIDLFSKNFNIRSNILSIPQINANGLVYLSVVGI